MLDLLNSKYHFIKSSGLSLMQDYLDIKDIIFYLKDNQIILNSKDENVDFKITLDTKGIIKPNEFVHSLDFKEILKMSKYYNGLNNEVKDDLKKYANSSHEAKA